MIVSMSLFCASEKFCADALGEVAHKASANRAGVITRSEGIGESSFRKPILKTILVQHLSSAGLFQLLFWPGIGLAVTISSALTHPGVPIAKRVLAREASSRAVLLSPRR